MPSSFLIVPPALIALCLYAWRFYKIDPERRVMNRDFLLGLACVTTVVIYTAVHGSNPGALVVPWAAFGLGWIFLTVAVTLMVRSPPMRKGLRSLMPH